MNTVLLKENVAKPTFEIPWLPSQPSMPNAEELARLTQLWQVHPEGVLQEFENTVKAVTGCGHAVALNSGTSALHLALELAGVKEGSTVLCSTYTFAATVNAIRYCGGMPELFDAGNVWGGMDDGLLEKELQHRAAKGKLPAAVVVVHGYGYPAENIETLAALCAQYQVPLIEDGAAGLGSFWNKRHVGTFGDFGIISFNTNKLVTTMGGGALLTRDEKQAQRALYLATQAKTPAPYYQHEQVGYNYRMNALAAAWGLVQFGTLEEKITKKKAIYNHYRQELASVPHVVWGPLAEQSKPNHWSTLCQLRGEANPGHVQETMALRGIEVRRFWKPMHLQPMCQGMNRHLNGQAETLFATGLALPSGVHLARHQLNDIVAHLKEVLC